MTPVKGTQSQTRHRPFSHFLPQFNYHWRSLSVAHNCAVACIYICISKCQLSNVALTQASPPVNSRENPNNLRILARRPYTDGGLAAAPDSPRITHALYAPIPRRAARPASGLGGRGQAREVEEGGAGVEGPVAVSAGEDAVVHRQRPEGILPRLLLRQARRHHLLPDGDRGGRLRRGRRAAGVDGGRAAARGHP